MQKFGATLADLSEKRAELERYKSEVSEAKGKAATTRNQIAEEQRKRRILLASVREEKAGHLATIKELEQSAKELQALIARLQTEEERQRRSGRTASRREPSRETPAGRDDTPDIQDDGRFSRLKGKLPWPAVGSLLSTFGRQEHPRFHTVTFNRGIGIAAPEGRDFVAVADGEVIYADWFKGYGRLIILDHGGGYFTLYAHAAEIWSRSGDNVTRGQVIGKVGDTGSLEGPQLYFELRHKGKPQDPLAWLQPR
jgi:septal ring factor EnvC (AmiA/AmiB activator)